jgi:hypothetical protein
MSWKYVSLASMERMSVSWYQLTLAPSANDGYILINYKVYFEGLWLSIDLSTFA